AYRWWIDLQVVGCVGLAHWPSAGARAERVELYVNLDAAAGSARIGLATNVFYADASAAGLKLLSSPYPANLNRTAGSTEAARHLARCVYHKGNRCVVVAKPSGYGILTLSPGVNSISGF